MANSRFGLSQFTGDQPLRVKLFGLGSAGCNMIQGLELQTVAFSTSPADLDRSQSDRKVLMSPERLVGVSQTEFPVVKHLPGLAGHEVTDLFENTDMAFMMCGLGGVSGSLGAKLFSAVARARGAFDVVLAATPFSAESIRRREFSSKALDALLKVSSLVVRFDNDELSTLAPNLPMSRAFSLMNSIMLRPVMDICASASRSDVGVLKQALGGANSGRFGLGLGRGDERVPKVVDEALSSPWFDFDLAQAPVAIAIYSAADPWDRERDKILDGIEARMPSARIVWGSYSDHSLGDRIRLSLIVCTKAR